MATPQVDFFSSQLEGRRERLKAALAQYGDNLKLTRLLEEVDSALQRLDNGTFGLCENCHETIEADRLLADPLVRLCLDHLTPSEQRALEADLDLAARIQKGLLPKLTQTIGDWEVFFHYQSAGPVSGDYVDLLATPSTQDGLFFVIGDVAGKGVAASMLMAHLQAIVRSLVSARVTVTQLTEQANRVFCESTLASHYATLVCGKASAQGEIEVCNAGHCPPLVVRRGEVSAIEATGLPVGLFCGAEYAAQKMQLAKDDSVFLYTDGLVEARSYEGCEYGSPRLSQVLSSNHSLAPAALARACLSDLDAFLNGVPKTDDLTVMVIQRRV